MASRRDGYGSPPDYGLNLEGREHMSGRRRLVIFGVLVGTLVFAGLLGGAGKSAADDVSRCAGKPICVVLTDQEQASKSLGGSNHYLTDSFVLSNGNSSTPSTSTLVNLVVTVTWADSGAATTTAYVPAPISDSRCTTTSTPNTLTCTVPSSLAPGETKPYGPLVFRTATDDNASGVTVTVRASAKEKTTPDKKGGGAPAAFVDVSNFTTYEGDPDVDISQAGDGLSATLATTNTGAQFSKLPVPATAARDLITISEGAITNCPTNFTCLGQEVTVTAPLLAPVNLQITYTGDLPGGTKPTDIVVLHPRSGDDNPVIDKACSGALFSGEQPPPSELSPDGCRRVSITNLPGGLKRVEIDAWDLGNGSWIWG
jgi:hypothetical protein